MKRILVISSLTALGVLFAGPVLHAAGLASADVGRCGIWIGTVGWFATAPFWIVHR